MKKNVLFIFCDPVQPLRLSVRTIKEDTFYFEDIEENLSVDNLSEYVIINSDKYNYDEIILKGPKIYTEMIKDKIKEYQTLKYNDKNIKIELL